MTVKVWTELVTFVTCPECEETIELGTDIVICDDEKCVCERCGTEFEITDSDR